MAGIAVAGALAAGVIYHQEIETGTEKVGAFVLTNDFVIAMQDGVKSPKNPPGYQNNNQDNDLNKLSFKQNTELKEYIQQEIKSGIKSHTAQNKKDKRKQSSIYHQLEKEITETLYNTHQGFCQPQIKPLVEEVNKLLKPTKQLFLIYGKNPKYLNRSNKKNKKKILKNQAPKEP